MAATSAGQVDINSDLGESFRSWVTGNNAEMPKKAVRRGLEAAGIEIVPPTELPSLRH